MTKPLQPIYLCMYCGNGYSQQTTKLIARCCCVIDDMYPWPLIPHYSLPDLERYLKERLEDTEAEIRDPSNSCRTTDRFVSRKWELEEILKDLKEAK